MDSNDLTLASDLEKLADTSGQVETPETIGELDEAQDTETEEMEFLNDQVERAREAKKENEQEQQKLQNRVWSKGR